MKITSVGRQKFGSTQTLKSYPKDHPFLVEFARYAISQSFSFQIKPPCSYLEGMSGGSKSKKVQDEAKVDLGKFLKYASSELLNSIDVININKIEGFLQLLIQLGIGPSGQVSKLNVISQAQTFLIHR